MKYDLAGPIDVQKFKVRTENVLNKKYFVELKRILPARSNQQNRYLHLLLSYFASEYGEMDSYVKQVMFKQIVNPEIFKTEFINFKTGEVRQDWKSTAELTTGELTTAIDRFRDYASNEAGIYLPEPNEDEFLRFCEVEIERNKQYI
jgi:hypothetical protein